MSVRRRSFLLGGIALVVGAGGAGLADWLTQRPPDGVPGGSAGRMVSGSFASSRARMTVGWTVAYPPGTHTDLPVCVSLHGRGGNHSSSFSGDLYLQNYLAEYVRGGGTPFAIASIDGGDHSYWHPRASGDTAGMVLHEFLPLLAARGLRTERIALYGWSMGGYGALYLASLLGRARVAAVVAESPAIWHEAAQSAAGAFDDAADFDAHAIFPRVRMLDGLALKIDCGASDGFAPVTRDLRAAIVPTPAGGIQPGNHDASYWRSQAAAAMRFVGSRF